jgi:hypothetical protein
MRPEDIKGIVFTRYFMLGELDAAAAARELATVPGLDLSGYYYWPTDLSDFQQKFADLRAELEKLGIKTPAA